VTGAPEPEPLAGAASLRLVLIGALIGVPAALLAAGFLALVHEFEDVLWHDLIFVGVALGTLATIVFDVSPTLAVAVGAAAGTAAGTRLLISSLLIAALLVGSAGFDAIPAAVLAASGAWLTVTMLDPKPATT
jgi:hypothetical protein